jgi:hypothetical protein
VCHIKGDIKEGEKEEDVNVNIEILPNIPKNVLNNSRKRKADRSVDYYHCKAYVEDPRDVEGDREGKLEEYCN